MKKRSCYILHTAVWAAVVILVLFTEFRFFKSLHTEKSTFHAEVIYGWILLMLPLSIAAFVYRKDIRQQVSSRYDLALNILLLFGVVLMALIMMG